jgi:hypothetical protein
MKKSGLLCGLMLLAGISISGAAQADHRGHDHIGVGFYFGVPYAHPYYGPYPYGPYAYYPPYPYYPPVVVAPAPQPPVYVEQQPAPSVAPAAPAPQASNSWYHCDSPEGYYPYIKECAGGWKAVTATPPHP